jgi:nicotinamidase-related amidase
VSSNTALLVIDVQNIFFHETHPIYNGEEVVSKIQALISKVRVLGVPVIYIKHLVGDKLGIQIDGTPLGAIHQAITPTENDLVICKTTPDSFLGTKLDEVLKEKGIKN